VKDKFLTVMAVFDEESQRVMHAMQDRLINRFGRGTQTMDIPFHISLGSFETGMEDELIKRVIDASKSTAPFEVTFNGLGHFGDKIIFLHPEENDRLRALHDVFDGNYADGFGWYAHATLFCCGESQSVDIDDCGVAQAEQLKSASIVGIELGEFFPTRKIINVPLEGK